MKPTNYTNITAEQWAAESARVDRLKDGLGSGVDAPIAPVVTALRLHGYSTVASCGGHVDGRGVGPYVLIESLAAQYLAERAADLDPGDEQYQTMRHRANCYRANVLDNLSQLLGHFYNKRDVGFGSRLVAHSMPWALVLLAPMAADTALLMKPEGATRFLRSNRREMRDFARFLRGSQPNRSYLSYRRTQA